MRRSVKVGVFLAAAGLALVGCSRASDDAPAPKVLARRDVTPVALDASPAVGRRAENVVTRGEMDAAASLPRPEDDPRSCDFQIPEQSCIPGADAVDFGCRSDCGSACTTCKDACRTRPGGAAALDACHDSCLATRDACATRCPQEIAEWEAAVQRNHGCKAKKSAFDICTRAFTCVQACKDGENGPCRARCERVHAAGCDRSFLDDVDLGMCGPYDYSL